jgi:hypothetical protein
MHSSGSEKNLRKVPVSLQHGRLIRPVYQSEDCVICVEQWSSTWITRKYLTGYAKPEEKKLFRIRARLGLPTGDRA